MKCDEQDVLFVGEPDEFGANHDVATEIKRLTRFLGTEPIELEFPIQLRSVREIDQWEVEAGGSCNLLARFAFDGDQRRAQSFMAGNHDDKGRLKTHRIDGACEAERMRQVVNGAIGLELLQEPKSMLRERQGCSIRP